MPTTRLVVSRRHDRGRRVADLALDLCRDPPAKATCRAQVRGRVAHGLLATDDGSWQLLESEIEMQGVHHVSSPMRCASDRIPKRRRQAPEFLQSQQVASFSLPWWAFRFRALTNRHKAARRERWWRACLSVRPLAPKSGSNRHTTWARHLQRVFGITPTNTRTGDHHGWTLCGAVARRCGTAATR